MATPVYRRHTCPRYGRYGVTLVELILALAIGLVGITVALVIAADVVEAAARTRLRMADSSQARVALVRLRAQLGAAQTVQYTSNIITLSGAGTPTTVWQVATLEGAPYIIRRNAGDTPQLSQAVAAGVTGMALQSGASGYTLGFTYGHSGYRLHTSIPRWGFTL